MANWEAVENGKRWAIFPAGPLGDAHILSVSTSAFDQEGIARLAAAAPELLAAVRYALNHDNNPENTDKADYRATLLAAIAKAEPA